MASDPRIQKVLISLEGDGLPSIVGVLRGVGCEMACWRPFGEWLNIRERALHVAHWENALANRISGVNRILGYKQRMTGWVVRTDTVDEELWQENMSKIKEVHERLMASVEGFDPELLYECVGKKTVKPAIQHIHGTAAHNAYHIGRIKMVKELHAELTAG